MDIFSRKILLVDDNQELLEMTTGILKKNGYGTIVTAYNFQTGCRVFEQEKPELAILDIMLPDGNGYELFQRIRAVSEIPILFLSAKDEDADRILGLGLGADDYITKPFLPQELVLRVGAILKRCYGRLPTPETEEKLQLGSRLVSLQQACVYAEDEVIPLTATELIIIKKLLANRGRIVTFDAICQAVWQENYYGYENTLMVHIRHLRQKVETDPSKPRWIITIRGVGYRLAGEENHEKLI